MAKKPHLIIFNPDEMRWDTMRHMGNEAAYTPFLDEIASSDAVSFSNAYCQNPVCVPSRCSFFTGLYPHTNGHRTMSNLLKPHEKSFFSEVKENGYYVWMNDRNDLYAGQIPGWVESNADEIYYAFPNGEKAPGPIEDPRGELGSKYYYSHYHGLLKTDEDGNSYNADDDTVDAAVEKIKNWNNEKPLCMFLGLMYPHVPYQIEKKYYDLIDRSKLPERVKFKDCSGKSKMIESYRKYQNLESLTDEEWDDIRVTYLAMVSKIDDQFKRLCDALKEAGMYDDSAIFMFSDHGDFAGNYELAEKAQSSYEDCLCRVPFLVKPPKGIDIKPGISDSMVELVDFYATAMDFAGIKPGQTHFGKSLVPVLKDHDYEIREFSCCEGGRLPGETWCDEYHNAAGKEANVKEEYWPKKKAQSDDFAHAKGIMIRTKNYKYVSRITSEDELYDMVNDPNEKHNLINDDSLALVKADLQIKLLKWLQSTSDIVPMEMDRRNSNESLYNKIKSRIPTGKEEEVRKTIENGISMSGLMIYLESLKENQ